MGGIVIHHLLHVWSIRHDRINLLEKVEKFSRAVTFLHFPITAPVAMSSAANRDVVRLRI